MTKLFKKTSLKQISKFIAIFCAIFLSFNTAILHFEAQAATLPQSTTLDATIELPSYYGFDADDSCSALGLPIDDANAGGNNPAGSNLQATNGDRYGDATCTIKMAYNDPDTDFEVYLYKKNDRDLWHDDYATNSEIISDIDNAGSDYIINTAGTDDTTEEWGYRLDTGTTPGTSLSPTGLLVNKRDEKYFDTKTGCSGGECFFAIPYSTGSGSSYSGADNIISGSNGVTPGSGTCIDVSASPDCVFDLEVHANIIYDTVPGHYGGDVAEEYYTIVVALDQAAQ